MKKTIFISIAAAMLLLAIPLCAMSDNNTDADDTAVNADTTPTIIIDGAALDVGDDEKPFIKNDRVLVPMRKIFEALGAEVEWNNEERAVTALKEDKNVELVIGSDIMNINTEAVKLDVSPIIVNDRTFVPLRVVSESLGYVVNWREDDMTVMINSVDHNKYTSRFMAELAKKENVVVSPISLKMAMMMAANGAEGETQKEILDAFDISDLENYNESVKALFSRLADINDGEVNIANSIWFNKDYYNIKKADFSDNFKNTISDIYKGKAEAVTNKNSVEAVNAWVEDTTKGKIKNLLTDSNRNYLATLVNTVYMKAEWVDSFKQADTYKDEFTDIDGNKTVTDFMHQTSYFRYYEDENTKMIRLPYTNGMSMYIATGDTKDAERIMDMFGNDYDRTEIKKIALSMPKFKIEYAIGLNDVLENMNVKKAFLNNNHDFDKMLINVPDPIRIDKVIQKAVIEVDEKGTEAAAATAVIMECGAALEVEEILDFKADKPFTYYIKDEKSGEIFFAGHYVRVE